MFCFTYKKAALCFCEYQRYYIFPKDVRFKYCLSASVFLFDVKEQLLWVCRTHCNISFLKVGYLYKYNNKITNLYTNTIHYKWASPCCQFYNCLTYVIVKIFKKIYIWYIYIHRRFYYFQNLGLSCASPWLLHLFMLEFSRTSMYQYNTICYIEFCSLPYA